MLVQRVFGVEIGGWLTFNLLLPMPLPFWHQAELDKKRMYRTQKNIGGEKLANLANGISDKFSSPRPFSACVGSYC